MKPLTPEIKYCRATVKAWERLRLYYNVLLVIPGIAIVLRVLHLQNEMAETDPAALAVSGVQAIGSPLLLVAYSFVFGFAANLCFCLGPYAEFVITALGFPITGQRTRFLIFGMGVTLSLGVMALPWLYAEYYFVSSLIPTP